MAEEMGEVLGSRQVLFGAVSEKAEMNPILVCLCVLAADPLGPGDHERSITVENRPRSYRIHIPKSYHPDKATPVVLVFHGAGMNASLMVPFSGMNNKSNEAGFVAVYPNGTGLGPFQTFNAGGLSGKMAEGKPDDVKFVKSLLDDLATVVNIDPKRVYASGMSNGGMMCYRLAAELSDRIAAIAPVSGTMAISEAKPKRTVPIMHFHGTADRVVPFAGPDKGTPKFLTFKSVEDTVRIWAEINHCERKPVAEKIPDKANHETTVTKKTYKPKNKDGAEIVLFEIENGGHTWPGRQLPFNLTGKSTKDISANDLIWDFFEKHKLP